MRGNSAIVFDANLSLNRSRFYRAVVWGATRSAAGSNYAWIPPGQFLMGSPATEEDRNSDEGPRTLVTVPRGASAGCMVSGLSWRPRNL
jgi:hypothetical protein